jgi:hypothetical protein
MNMNIRSYLETSGSHSSNLYLNVVHFFNASLRHLWQLETVAFLHWCQICAVLLTLSKKRHCYVDTKRH